MNSKTLELNRERWAQVEALFELAMASDPVQRPRLIAEHCADDELRRYVEELVNAGSGIDSAIEQTIVDAIGVAFADDAGAADQMHGEMIGAYRVERLLGSGGMGFVYLASRADKQYDQQVAIKLGRHRLIDPQTELRLRHERQILANLDHPNIARLFDGGTTLDGVPYLVMEYINGVRIDTYCDRHRLTIADRLKLFQTICAAVHYAHQNLVIHRDIKAANILVTDEGTPKLLDFGIAKLIDTQGAATDGLTREGHVVMTPENAAPEQMLGKTVTTATDTYALGLLLYRLLSGLPAHAMGDMSPAQFARVVCFQDAIRPSLAVRNQFLTARQQGDAEMRQSVSQTVSDRATSTERLQRRLRGDLDTIVLNSLHLEPERRYRSVNALADDIDLHLRSMPIIARADSWRYRSGKFLRRHYASVSALAVALALLVSFAVVLSVQNKRISEERDTAREVSKFLEDIFMTSDPANAQGLDISAQQILATGARRIRTDLNDRPDIQAALMGTIGRVYYNLGAYEPSLAMLQDALRLRINRYGENDVHVASARNDLAEVLIRQGDYARAESLLLKALDVNRRESGSASPQIAKNQFNLAEVYLATGKLDQAEAEIGSSISIYSSLGKPYGIDLAESKNTLARILQVRGDLDGTEALLDEAIDIVNRTEGPDHPLMAYYLQNLGVLQFTKGDLKAAEATLDRAIATARRVLGDKHDLVATTMVFQGSVLQSKGEYDRAEKKFRDALALHREILGNAHPFVGYDLTMLGSILHDKGELPAAEKALREALDIFKRSLDSNHQYTASALTELGAVLNSEGHPAEALPLLERALKIRKEDYAPGQELVAATQTEYADSLTRLGRLGEAGPLLRASVAALHDKPGRRKERAVQALGRLQRRTDDDTVHVSADAGP